MCLELIRSAHNLAIQRVLVAVFDCNNNRLLHLVAYDKALTDLTFSKKRIAADVKKCLQSAIANAENNHQLDVDRLFVKEVTVGKSMVMKRWRARARGRVGRIEKPFSNLTVIVREREETE